MSTRPLPLAARRLVLVVAIAVTAVFLVGWYTQEARADHATATTVHACAANSGALRLVSSADECNKNETALTLATGDGLSDASDRIAALEATVTTLQAQNADQAAAITDLEDEVADQASTIAGLEATFSGVSRNGDLLTFTGMNLQLTNGQEATNATNGLGNLIIGNNQQRPPWLAPAERTGSHYLVIGDRHEYTSHSGIIAGSNSTATARYASVTGGLNNTASGSYASVSGGRSNTASGDYSAILGGSSNTVSTFGVTYPVGP